MYLCNRIQITLVFIEIVVTINYKMSVQFIPLSDEYRSSLAEYMHKIYPSFTNDYIEYNINEGILGNQERTSSFIVLDENKTIVGCHLSFSTKAWIHGKELPVVWGHDTYLDSEYRREIGLDFVLEIAAIKNGFGLGLSDINVKIQKKMRAAVLIDDARKYCIISPWIIWRKCQSLFKISSKFPVLPTTISIGNNTFVQCKTAEDISIPNNGYWNKDICEVDFIRDKDFLNKRFFQNPVHTYTVYTIEGESCYFVIRPILFRGFYALMLADYRYEYTRPIFVHVMYKAIIKLCNKNKFGAVLFTTNDNHLKDLINGFIIYRSYPVVFVGGKENLTSKDSFVLLSAADSDDEFHK